MLGFLEWAGLCSALSLHLDGRVRPGTGSSAVPLPSPLSACAVPVPLPSLRVQIPTCTFKSLPECPSLPFSDLHMSPWRSVLADSRDSRNT